MNRLKAYLTVNDVETGKSEAYPYLKPLELDARMEDVFDQSMAIINSLPHWKLVSARSKSRIGKDDFGKNAKNIELFFKELRKRVRIP